MNPIVKALSDLKFKIPKQVLEKAFLPTASFGGLHNRTPLSLDFHIRQEVINARVLEDCNLVGGMEVSIPIGALVPEYLPEYKVVWKIPLKLTQNRRITKVLSIVQGRGGVPVRNNMYSPNHNAYTDASSGLLSSHTSIPNISNAEIDLIGENTVMAHMHIPATPLLYLRCVIENDQELNNLPGASVPKFSKLVELAVKSYIYNKLIITLDEAYLQGGQQLGSFLNIVEGFSDAEELYTEYLEETWRVVAFLSDKKSKKRHLRSVIGGGR